MSTSARVWLAGLGLIALGAISAPVLNAGSAAAEAAPDHSQAALFRDFSGYWTNMQPISVEKYETIAQPLTPAYQAKKEEQTRNRATGKQIFTSDAQCIPHGMPRMMMSGSFEVLARPNSLGLVVSGGGMQIRNIWLDGRKPTPEDDLFDSFSGESIGHWEGDTLVVHTTGLRESNEILYGVQGHKLTVDERIRKTGPDTLEVATTVYDPVVFTKPWVYTLNFKRTQARGLDEQAYCVAALDREVDKEGKEIFNLTPPPDPLAVASAAKK